DYFYWMVKDQTEKLAALDMNRIQTDARQFWGEGILQSIAERVEKTGLPLGRDIAKRFRNFAEFTFRHRTTARVKGAEVQKYMGEALIALGVHEFSRFEEFFFNPAMNMLNSRPELADGKASQKAKEAIRLRCKDRQFELERLERKVKVRGKSGTGLDFLLDFIEVN